MRIIRKTHTFRNSYSKLKTIHKKKYPTASMDSIELHGVRVDEKATGHIDLQSKIKGPG